MTERRKFTRSRPPSASSASRSQRAPCVAVCLIALSVAWAKPSNAQSNAAQALFDGGVADMLAGRYASACPAIQRSYELEPLPGVMFTLAECFARSGKTLTALRSYETFRRQLAELPPARSQVFAEREQLAIAKIKRLNELVPELKINVPSSTPATLVITRNAEVLSPAEYSEPVRLDPGEYTLRAQNDGDAIWERHVRLSDGAHLEVAVPWGAAQAKRTAPPSSPEPRAPAREQPSRGLAYAAGIVGVTGMAVGLIAGASAWGQKGDIARECPERSCTPAGRKAVDSAQTAATVSTIGFSVGLLGVASALGLWLIPRSASQHVATNSGLHAALVADRHGAGLGVSGSFQ